MYRSYSYNSMPHPVNTHSPEESTHQTHSQKCDEHQGDGGKYLNRTKNEHIMCEKDDRTKSAELSGHDNAHSAVCQAQSDHGTAASSFPFGLEKDDIILLIVIAILLFNDCDDTLLLIALAYIFFADHFKS